MPFQEVPLAKAVAVILILSIASLVGLLALSKFGPCELTKTDCHGFAPFSSLSRVQDELSLIVKDGYGVSMPIYALMKEGENMTVEEVAKTVGIERHSLRFICEPKESFCQGPGASLEVIETPQAGRISANTNVRAYFIACGDDSIGKFCIGVGPLAQDARNACTEGCEIR